MPTTEQAVERALDKIMHNEGGWADNPNDRGGPTNRGVTLATLQKLRLGATIDDLKALTDADARDIYRQTYIHAPLIDQLPPEIIPQCADCSVNHGPPRAIKLLQLALGLAPDGIIGPVTLATADDAVAKFGAAVNNQIADRRQAFYNAIVANDPTQREWLAGWTIRCNNYRVS